MSNRPSPNTKIGKNLCEIMKRYLDIIRKKLKSPALRELWNWSGGCRGAMAVICLLQMLSAVGLLVIAVSTRGLIDGATAHDKGQTICYAVVMGVSVIGMRVCALLGGLLEVRTGTKLLADLRSMLLRNILKKQYAKMHGFHSGELTNRMFSDVSIVKNGIMEIVPGLVNMAVSFVGGAIILIRMDWRLIVLMVLGGVFGLLLILIFEKPMKARHKEVQESEGRFHAILQETMENLRLIKASGSEKRMLDQVEQRQDKYRGAQLHKGYFAACLNGSISIVFQMSWFFCMLWGCFGIYRGQLTYGMLAATIQLIGMIQGPLAGAAGLAAKMYGMISSAERIKEMLDLPGEEALCAADGTALYQRLREIRVCDLGFSYGRGSQPVLEHVNFCIHPGDFIAVTGASGSGKSTLFHLLLQIYAPDCGTMEFIGKDGTREPMSGRMRSLFAYVPQGNTLFSGTLRENLTMFTDYASEEEIMEAVETACMDSFIRELSDGLETLIGERGIGLSEGQAQRIAVARALLSGAPILLLDESTSALDEETEARLLSNIARKKEKTCLIVTHRRAALEICDSRIHIHGNSEVFVLY